MNGFFFIIIVLSTMNITDMNYFVNNYENTFVDNIENYLNIAP